MPNGVVDAPPGTYYTDTAGTNGAWRWIKTSGTGNTGWTVIFGDTGWRYIANPANIAGRANFYVREDWRWNLRRVGNLCSLMVFAKSLSRTTSGTAHLFTIPPEFTPASVLVTGAGGFLFQIGYSVSLIATPDAGVVVQDEIKWWAREPWPTTLPGTPIPV